MIAPATLNSRSTLAEVAGMLRYFVARRQKVEKSFDKVELQNVSGGSLVVGCDRYTTSSPKLYSELERCDAEEVNLAKMLLGVALVRCSLVRSWSPTSELAVEDDALLDLHGIQNNKSFVTEIALKLL